MNVFGLVALLLGLFLLTVGVTGKQDNLIAAWQGRAFKSSTLT